MEELLKLLKVFHGFFRTICKMFCILSLDCACTPEDHENRQLNRFVFVSVLQIRPLLEEIERNKLRWFGHVKRMDTEKKPRKFLEWRPTGKRPTGRPRRRWIEGVEAALKRRGTSLREIEENKIYERREDWRCLVKSSLADR